MFRPPVFPTLREVLFLGAALGVSGSVRAEGKTDPAAPMRLLKAHCLSCHNGEKRKGGLALTSREAMLAGGDEGAVLVEGKPEESALIQSLEESADPHMPPKKQLSAAQIKILSDWVSEGAPWDAASLAGASAPRAVTLSRLPAAYRPVMTLALSPDGSRLAAGCGNELVLFDTGPGGMVFRGRAHAHLDPVQSLAWSPDGKSLVTGSFRRVVVWDADPVTEQREITAGLTDRITAVVALPEAGRVLVADGVVTESGIVRELDLTTGEVIRSWTAHDDTIFAMALSHDGKRLATAGGDRLLKVWDLASGRESARMEAHSSQVLSVAFHPDDSQLVTGGADRQLKVWDVRTRENVISLPGKTSAFNALQWNPAGPAVFAVLEDGSLLKYTDFKTHTGAQSSDAGRERSLGHVDAALYCLTVSADGERVFAGTRDARILSWDKDGKLLVTLNAVNAGTPSSSPP